VFVFAIIIYHKKMMNYWKKSCLVIDSHIDKRKCVLQHYKDVSRLGIANWYKLAQDGMHELLVFRTFVLRSLLFSWKSLCYCILPISRETVVDRFYVLQNQKF
jgi:hypothetical protein